MGFQFLSSKVLFICNAPANRLWVLGDMAQNECCKYYYTSFPRIWRKDFTKGRVSKGRVFESQTGWNSDPLGNFRHFTQLAFIHEQGFTFDLIFIRLSYVSIKEVITNLKMAR